MELGYYFQLLFTLSLLGLVLFALSKLSKRIQSQRYSGEINIIDRRPVEHGVSLLVVQIQDHKYLLSVSGKQTNLISQLEP